MSGPHLGEPFPDLSFYGRIVRKDLEQKEGRRGILKVVVSILVYSWHLLILV